MSALLQVLEGLTETVASELRSNVEYSLRVEDTERIKGRLGRLPTREEVIAFELRVNVLVAVSAVEQLVKDAARFDCADRVHQALKVFEEDLRSRKIARGYCVSLDPSERFVIATCALGLLERSQSENVNREAAGARAIDALRAYERELSEENEG